MNSGVSPLKSFKASAFSRALLNVLADVPVIEYFNY